MKTDKQVDQHVGQRIKNRRLHMELSQTNVGIELGISFQQVQKYEVGSNRVSASKLYRLSKVLSVGPSYFFAGLDNG